MGSDKTSNVGIEGEKIGLTSKWLSSPMALLDIPSDEDILHYYLLAKIQQKKAKWPSYSRAATV
jgi:hypothetical protein